MSKIKSKAQIKTKFTSRDDDDENDLYAAPQLLSNPGNSKLVGHAGENPNHKDTMMDDGVGVKGNSGHHCHTPVPTPDPIPTPVPTPTPVPEPIPVPTPVPTPTPVPEPIPVPTPVPDVPHVLGFEDFAVHGLAAAGYVQGSTAAPNSMIGSHYADRGIMFENAAIVNLGIGHTVDGAIGVAGVNAAGQIDYDAPISLGFLTEVNGAQVAGTVSSFSYSPDQWGNSNNTLNLYAYDSLGSLLGHVSQVESGTINNMTISGVGEISKIVIDNTLLNINSGGIALDMFLYDSVQALQLNDLLEPAGSSMDSLLAKSFGDVTAPVTNNFDLGLDLSFAIDTTLVSVSSVYVPPVDLITG